mmetsp:Transcript_31498/g.100343  ORF Transcript_31498/g.100343 Transcript_31498/m.100343 type:complete len:747 (+) Transcript_31498:177-2417(+)
MQATRTWCLHMAVGFMLAWLRLPLTSPPLATCSLELAFACIVLLLPADALENLFAEEHRHGEGHDHGPIVPIERADVEDLRQHGHVEDHEVDGHGAHARQDEPRVRPRGHLDKGAILGQGVKRIQHLDDHEDRQRQGGGLDLAHGEVRARILLKTHAHVGLRLEVLPSGTLAPSQQLAHGHQAVLIRGRSVEAIPINKDTDRGEAHIQADHHVAEEDPAGDQVVVLASRRLLHHVQIGRVEAESRGRQAIGHEVDPEQLHRGQALGAAKRGREEDGGHLANVGGDQVPDEGLHVVVDGPALFHGVHDGREVIVGEHHVRGLLGHLGARDAHGNADVGLLQRGGVVDAVAGHGGDLAETLQDLHNHLLVLGLGAREHGALHLTLVHDALEHLGLLLVGHFLELLAREGLPAVVGGVGEDAEVRGDGLGGDLIVAGDHDDADPRDAAVLNGLLALGAGGVDDADHADEGELHLDLHEVVGILELGVALVRRPIVIGQVQLLHVELCRERQRAEGIAGHLLHLDLDGLLAGGGEGLDAAARQHDRCAPLEDAFGRALDVEGVGAGVVGVRAQDAHGLALAGELQGGMLGAGLCPEVVESHGILGGPLCRLVAIVVHRLVGASELLHEHHDGGLGGLALPHVAALDAVEAETGLVAHRPTLREGLEALIGRPFVLQVLDGAHGGVGDTGNLVHLQGGGGRRQNELLDAHLVGRQGAGLVRADHGGAAQGLDGGQLAHDGVALGHLPGAQR